MTNFKIKSTAIFVLFIVFSANLHSQDLIVTSEGDSLNCKITNIKTENIYFTFKHKNEIRSTLLPVNQVKYYQYNFFQTTEVPADKVTVNEIYPHFRAAFNGGLSNRTAKLADNIPSEFEQYMKNLKSGYNYNLDLSYFFAEQLGIGFKYNVFLSKNEIENIYVKQPDGSTLHGKMSDDITINFIGPFFSTRLLNSKKNNSLICNIGLGYTGYTDNAVVIYDLLIKGNTLGICLDIGYDVGISDNVAIGFQISLLNGTLTQYELSQGTYKETVKLEDEYESLARIDLSIGLRFSK